MAEDEAGERILNYGGEQPNEDVRQLVDRLRELHPSTNYLALGLFISLTSAIGLLLASRAKRSAVAPKPRA